MDELLPLIMQSEVAMARRIAIAVRTLRPVSVGGTLIPGKFLFDFLGRMREIRWSIDRYLPLRHEAIEEARERLEGGTPNEPADDDPAAELRALLTDYYEKLLEAGGEGATEAIRAAFETRQDFVLVLNAIGRAESRLDRAATAARPDDARLAGRLEEYRERATEQRLRYADEVYVQSA